MNTFTQTRLPLSEPVDVLLADVAIRVQLSATDHNLAVERYNTINDWIERPGSPLKDRVELFYAQGSMAIGATVASKLEYDEFDIDLIAQLDVPPNTPPHQVLDLLEASIKGDPGSRYYDMVNRCTRCIQIKYAGMHLDVTPMVRLPQLVERCGYIYHAPESRASADDRRIVANPWGFAQWFTERTPADHAFAVAYASMARSHDQAIALAKADSEPVPEQIAVHEKSMAVIALQLLKRWRNVQYDQREGRCPPSVVLAKFVADNANQTPTLSQELLHQARQLRVEFGQAQVQGRLVRVENPACTEDVFTDRWPGTPDAQRVFVDDLTVLINRLEELQGECTQERMREIMSELFGERPTIEAFKFFHERAGRAIREGRSAHVPGSGRFVIPTAAAAAAPAGVAVATPKHTYFGGPKDA
jgi:hypothetical protein